MSVKEISAYPETGWGMPFQYFFDSTVVVDNRAKKRLELWKVLPIRNLIFVPGCSCQGSQFLFH
jgi:hypothetical protein